MTDDNVKAVLKLAEVAGGNMLATKSLAEESAMLRGFIIGNLFVEGGANAYEALVLLKAAKLIADALAYRRSQGNEIPDGVLSGMSAEKFQKARAAMEEMARYVEDNFFDADTDISMVADILRMIDEV